ncbi:MULTISPECIES: MarR family winged helix-turn-helix transcriptional regulator [unclassified Streptomyces]|uniref:MarR family winged helix-turn-helix transcriptional regulator n=1 Tax=unclassified Streptomyces TaxID=2593676 RepID=UPI002259F3CA|nr:MULTISPECIES: MarR family winged helix-turn-helix transcriptional regulator [unclassified Streptomyces]MCX5140711.1 MarR family winged helix-turn-helix transcriptional regulator [Streptomyces sp. NBC_00338]WRZ65236.1 MarR family winged helix-turn-helix transcriptional regulator [Streptomyces sp. NBC_01257]WSU59236.1 MarR family winged helix-turn-helix transcriptional regulator [Streptomyces sp. NBC_01104]
MKDVKRDKLTDTVSFRLGTVGAITAELFAERIAAHGLKPKHAGLMALLASGAAASQQEIARTMRVTPSLVVGLADHLEELGAVGRERDPGDRRRQILTLTDRGRELLGICTSTASAIDEELTAGLDDAFRDRLRETLAVLAERAGLPG